MSKSRHLQATHTLAKLAEVLGVETQDLMEDVIEGS